MALDDYRADAMRCTRCTYCKWIPFDLVKSYQFAKGCPSIEAGKFHAYSAGGKLVTALQPDGRAQRGHRPGRRRRLQVPALRQLRRGLQGLPLRHGADPRAARVPRAPRGDGPRARVVPPADRADAGGARRQGSEDPGRPQRLGRGARPQGPGGRGPSTSCSTRAAGTPWRRACARRCARRSACSSSPASPSACSRTAAAAASPTRWATATRPPRPAPGCSSSGPTPASRPSSRRAPTASTVHARSTRSSRARGRTCRRSCTPWSASTSSSRTGGSSSPRPCR